MEDYVGITLATQGTVEDQITGSAEREPAPSATQRLT